MKNITLDASSAIHLVSRNDSSNAIQTAISDASLVLAPTMYQSEVANACWKVQRAGQISERDADQRFDAARDLIGRYVEDADLFPEALYLALSQDYPVYDCLYLVLARRTASRLCTRDKRLAKLAETAGVEVV